MPIQQETETQAAAQMKSAMEVKTAVKLKESWGKLRAAAMRLDPPRILAEDPTDKLTFPADADKDTQETLRAQEWLRLSQQLISTGGMVPAGESAPITIAQIDAAVTDEEKALLGVSSLRKLVPTQEQVEQVSTTVGKSAARSVGTGVEFLDDIMGGASFFDIILGFINWLYYGAKDGMDGLQTSIANQTGVRMGTNVKDDLEELRDTSKGKPNDLSDILTQDNINEAARKASEAPAKSLRETEETDPLKPIREAELGTFEIPKPQEYVVSTPAKAHDKTQPLENTNEQVFVQGTLTAMLTAESARTTVAMVEGIKYKSANGDYLAVDANIKGQSPTQIITQDSIKQIEITAPGKAPRYYKQLVASNDTKETGFKAIAWLETYKDGKAVMKENGKANVTLAFAGYDGHPNDNSAQTKAMYDIADANRYRQIDKVPGFITATNEALKKEGITATDTSIVAHSMGASNALKASVDLEKSDTKPQSVLLLEPVGASLAVKVLKSDKDADEKTMDAVVAKTTSVRNVTVDTKNNNGPIIQTITSKLQTVGDKNGKSEEEQAKESAKVKASNMAMYNPFNGSAAQKAPIHENNRMVGTELFMNSTGQDNKGSTAAAALDGKHVTGSIVHAARNGADIDSPERTLAHAKTPPSQRQNNQPAPSAEASTTTPSTATPETPNNHVLEKAYAYIQQLFQEKAGLIENTFNLTQGTLLSVLSERNVLQNAQMKTAGNEFNMKNIEQGKQLVGTKQASSSASLE